MNVLGHLEVNDDCVGAVPASVRPDVMMRGTTWGEGVDEEREARDVKGWHGETERRNEGERGKIPGARMCVIASWADDEDQAPEAKPAPGVRRWTRFVTERSTGSGKITEIKK